MCWAPVATAALTRIAVAHDVGPCAELDQLAVGDVDDLFGQVPRLGFAGAQAVLAEGENSPATRYTFTQASPLILALILILGTRYLSPQVLLIRR